MKYGESLTSPEVMSRLAEGEKRKKGEQSKDLKRENNKKKRNWIEMERQCHKSPGMEAMETEM